MNKRFIIIHGPTGVGKTDFVNKMSDNATVEIINCDVGQLYKPFSIGTAKPDWCNEKIPHHLFDRMTTPDNYSVTTYRKEVEQLMQEIWQRN